MIFTEAISNVCSNETFSTNVRKRTITVSTQLRVPHLHKSSEKNFCFHMTTSNDNCNQYYTSSSKRTCHHL